LLLLLPLQVPLLHVFDLLQQLPHLHNRERSTTRQTTVTLPVTARDAMDKRHALGDEQNQALLC
jgi:hypothetical protein